MICKFKRVKGQISTSILCRQIGCIKCIWGMPGNMICNDLHLIETEKENFQLRIEYMIELCYNHYNLVCWYCKLYINHSDSIRTRTRIQYSSLTHHKKCTGDLHSRKLCNLEPLTRHTQKHISYKLSLNCNEDSSA